MAVTGHAGLNAGSGLPMECGNTGGLPVLNVAGTRVGIRILAQGQQQRHVPRLATQPRAQSQSALLNPTDPGSS